MVAAALSFFAAHPVLVGLAGVVIVLALAAKINHWRKYGGYKLPPAVASWIPFVGAGLSFAGGPLQFVTKMYKQYGEIFTIPMFGQRLTFLVGPEAHVPFFSKNDEELSQEDPYKFSVPIFGPGVVYDADLAHRTQQLRFIAASLSSKALASYVPLIVKEAEDYFSQWPQTGVIDIKKALSELIILTASRCLMGKEIRENLFTEVASLYQTLDEGLTPISVFFPYLPIPAHKRRDKARLDMVELFKKIIAQRRQHPEETHNDCLQVFMDAKYRDEQRHLTDEEITGLMIALLFAGQHTSSVTSSWTGLLLLESENRKKFLPAVLAEQEEVLAKHDGKLDFDALNEMKCLHRCVKEALRMYPPLIFVMRQVSKPFQFKDYYVPQGDILFVSPALSMRLGEVFPEPDKFNPDRFIEEDQNSGKYRYLGFGAGRHGCMGENFAYLQIKTIWSVLLRNFEMELVGQLPKPDYKAMVVGPTQPCLLKYSRRS
jgi:sterol 14-demethylase